MQLQSYRVIVLSLRILKVIRILRPTSLENGARYILTETCFRTMNIVFHDFHVGITFVTSSISFTIFVNNVFHVPILLHSRDDRKKCERATSKFPFTIDHYTC